jgi:hypothetical protein
MKPITNHVARGLSRLIQKFKNKPNVVGFLAALLQEVQELDDAIYDASVYRLISNAYGATLDLWGKLLKYPRGSLGDESYRVRLQVQVLLLRSSGTAQELLTVFQLLAPAPNAVRFWPLYPAGFELYLSGPGVSDGDDFAAILASAKAGGVRGIFRWSGAPDENTFCFDGDPAGLGFGLSTDSTVGGTFARAVG